ncbi:MAG: hypothetical protein ACE5JL_07775 [Dehalococcoidia bacterium]
MQGIEAPAVGSPAMLYSHLEGFLIGLVIASVEAAVAENTFNKSEPADETPELMEITAIGIANTPHGLLPVRWNISSGRLEE